MSTDFNDILSIIFYGLYQTITCQVMFVIFLILLIHDTALYSKHRHK